VSIESDEWKVRDLSETWRGRPEVTREEAGLYYPQDGLRGRVQVPGRRRQEDGQGILGAPGDRLFN
jgi:hypothetical protein